MSSSDSTPSALGSSVGTKIVIGLTGFALFLYLLIHIAGNLLIFFGPTVFNNYAYVMEDRNPLLPIIEIALLLVFLIHIYKTVRMFIGNKQARPVGYAMKKYAGKPSRKTFASSTMIISGLWLVAFLLVHVKAFRFSPNIRARRRTRFVRQEMESLSNPLVVGFTLSMLVVGSHLARRFERRPIWASITRRGRRACSPAQRLSPLRLPASSS